MRRSLIGTFLRRYHPDAAQKRRVELGCPHLNTYGSRMHPNDGRVVSIFVIQALLGQDITVYGDGSQTRSFRYVGRSH
jgi:dTDP-D-glucose 4,6-dehydratase